MTDMPNTIKITKDVKLQEKYLHLLKITKPTKKTNSITMHIYQSNVFSEIS